MNRILFYGNKGNAGLRLASWVRRVGHEATLLVPRRITHDRSRPEWQNPSLAESYPPWIERYRSRRWLDWLVPPRAARSEARRADVVVTTGQEVVGALALDVPIVFFPMGSEIIELPFRWTVRSWPRTLVYRHRLKRVSRVLSAQENVHETARRLGIGDRAVRYPIPTDPAKIRELVNQDLLGGLEDRYANRDAVFLLLSRKTLNPDRQDYKAPEKFARALKRFFRTEKADSIGVVVGLHGREADEFRDLLSELGLEDRCDYVGHLRRPDLHAYFSLPQAVVFDQFGGITRHNLNGSVREALSLGTPIVTATDVEAEEFRTAYGPDCPLLDAETEQEIFDRMREVASWSPERFESIREESLQWSRRHLDWRSRIPEFVDILRDAAAGRSAQSGGR